MFLGPRLGASWKCASGGGAGERIPGEPKVAVRRREESGRRPYFWTFGVAGTDLGSMKGFRTGSMRAAPLGADETLWSLMARLPAFVVPHSTPYRQRGAAPQIIEIHTVLAVQKPSRRGE